MATSIENELDELLCCAICLGTLSEPKLLPCSHRFCKLCIIQEMDRSASPKGSTVCFPCPLCKREIKLGKGRKGEEWIVKFETDRLLNDIKDLLKRDKDEIVGNCSSHRKVLSLVCYSCGTAGCYICAWHDHRSCSDVKNFQTEAKKMNLELQTHLEESEKFKEKIVSFIAKWSSFKKSLKNQRDCSNRFIETHLQNLQRESVSAVRDLVQDYECYIARTRMSKGTEKELRRLMETFSLKVNGEIDLFNIQSRLQSQNEIIIFPQIQHATKSLVQDVQVVTSTVEDIKQIQQLDKKDLIFKGKDLLKKKANDLSKRYRDNLLQSIDATLPYMKLDSFVTRTEQIDLDNKKGERLLRELKVALLIAKNPQQLMETTGRLCFPGGYHSPFDTGPKASLNLIRRQQPNPFCDGWDQQLLGDFLTERRHFKSYKRQYKRHKYKAPKLNETIEPFHANGNHNPFPFETLCAFLVILLPYIFIPYILISYKP